MTISTEQVDGIMLIELVGRLDGFTMNEVENRFLELLEQGSKQFVFNMSGLEYISSAGLRVMLLAAKKTRAAGGRIALYAMNSNVDEVFRISGFSTIFTIMATREEALEYAASV